MRRTVTTVALADDLLARVADLVLTDLPGASTGDLGDALVLLPSSRACHDLRRVLLDRSGRSTLLLPRVLTDSQWAGELAAALDPGGTDLPGDNVRPLLLARRLAEAPWLAGGPTAAPGLAEAFVVFLDEARRHGMDRRLLAADDGEPLLRLARDADAEIVAAEVARLREMAAWYRADIPRDNVDLVAGLTSALENGTISMPPRPALVVVAGFGRVDPLRATLLRTALDHGQAHHLVVPEPTTALDRRFLATWGEGERTLDPLAPTRHQLTVLDATPPQDTDPDDAPLGERLAALTAAGVTVDTGAPRLVEAEDREAEALAVAALVADHLAQHGAPQRGVTIATNDPRLADRITARLRDAGLDADNTVGEALGALPAGLLLRFLLRAALTDLRAAPLLEVLGHPYTDLAVGRTSQGVWALRLERMVRRETGPQSGLAGLHRRARDRDTSALALFDRQAPGMDAFVERLAQAFAPLLDLAQGKSHGWPVLLSAARAVWVNLAPERPLVENPEWPDITALARLLDGLDDDAARLPDTDLAGFTADLGRLLSGSQVVPHRPRGIPVVVTGMVEARLVRTDLLVLAGLNDGVFPAASTTPVMLPGRVRLALGLPTWREAKARDAELFLRLLHAAPQVVLTWSRWRDQQPALMSPLVERLGLALDGAGPEAAPTSPWRAEAPPLEAVLAGQTAFVAEPQPVPRHAQARPLTEVSWTALAQWRECPYRSLLARGFALKADEEVSEEFGKREFGNVVHAVLCEALAPDHPCHAALAAGHADKAAAALLSVARAHFLPGSDVLPERGLWFGAFADLAPTLVAVEVERFAARRPLVLEAKFRLPLVDLYGWLSARGNPEPLPDHAATVVLTGAVDRVDDVLEAPDTLAVIDYKTGSLPSFKAIAEHEDLQLSLYALAVELGAVSGCRGTVQESVYYAVSEKACGPARPSRGTHPLERTPGAEDPLVEAAAALLELAVTATAPEAPAALLPRFAAGVGSGKLPCEHCDHRGLCRIEERAPSPAVAEALDKVVNSREQAR